MEHKPKNQNSDGWLDKYPQNSQIVVEVAGFEIVFDEINEQAAIAYDIAYKTVKINRVCGTY
ncbi:MAG: hypothetical protein ACXWVX_04630 [Sulfuricurvum sp.]